MTRKDYQRIADAIFDARNKAIAERAGEPLLQQAAASAAETVATFIADELVQDNPRFDRARFMAACGFQ